MYVEEETQKASQNIQKKTEVLCGLYVSESKPDLVSVYTALLVVALDSSQGTGDE